MKHFHPAEYLEFAKDLDVSKAECVLCFSGITCPWSLAELGIDGRIFEKGRFYPYGNDELKEAIAARYGVRLEQILLPGGGTSLPNFLIAAALLDPGDRVLVETPTYEPLLSTIASTGAEVVRYARRFDDDYRIAWDELERLMRPPVKLVALTRLHNPSGKDVSDDLLLRLGEKAESIGAYVLVDEVYLDFLPPGSFKVAAALHPRLITTSSLTKVYGMGDLRLGWALGPKDLIWKCWRINNVLGAVPPTAPELAALELLQNGGLDRIGQWARARASENISIMEAYLRNHARLSWVKPDGGIIAFLRLKSGRDSIRLTDGLREKHKILVMPGRFFAQNDGFRVGFGIPADQLREGLRRIDLALGEL